MTVNQSQSLSTLATDPLRNFKWQLVFRPSSGSAITWGAMTLSGLGMTIDVIPYREGGYNVTTQKMPGQADFNPITLSKGVILGQDQDVQWIQQLFTVMQGTGNTGPATDFRYTVDVYIIDHPVTTATAPIKLAFRIYKAWPTAIAWGDLDAGANQVFVRQCSLAHEGIDYSAASNGGDASEAPAFAS